MRPSFVALCCYLGTVATAFRKVKQARTDSGSNTTAVLDDTHIICPVMAILFRTGKIKADSNGDVELADLYDALHNGLGIAHEAAEFQAYGIVKYDLSQKGIELHTNACTPGTWCYTYRWGLGIVDDSTRRYFNLFKMNGKQAIEHGISTGINGGDTNMPPNALDCKGKYPCRARFDQFFGGVVTNDRFYIEDLMKVVCKARKYGDRGGEYAYEASNTMPGTGWDLGPVPAREWQMKGATSSLIGAFGRSDEQGKEYLTMADLEAIYMERRPPDGWKMRKHGCLLWGCTISSYTRFNYDVKCDVDYNAPFWQGTGCEVYTGRTCSAFSGCKDGETCVGSKCLCSRGNNLRTMCFKNGACREQESDDYSWFGGSRNVVVADNPSPPGNP